MWPGFNWLGMGSSEPSEKARNLLTNSEIISFSGTALLHGIN